MSDQLLRALGHIDRLNSWVRSDGFRHTWQGSSTKRHVYDLKRRAIIEADQRLECTHRPLSTLVTCRDCGGTGRYTDWAGFEHNHCRACENTGVARLHFVESRIGSFRWHSPAGSFPLASSKLGVETTAGDWTVNEKGRDLTMEEVAESLLACDGYFLPAYWQTCRCGDYREECPIHYGLYIGRSVAACGHCGGVAKENCGGNVGRVSFTFAACEECRAKMDTAELFNVGIPGDLLTPNVAEWVRVNEATKR